MSNKIRKAFDKWIEQEGYPMAIDKPVSTITFFEAGYKAAAKKYKAEVKELKKVNDNYKLIADELYQIIEQALYNTEGESE